MNSREAIEEIEFYKHLKKRMVRELDSIRRREKDSTLFISCLVLPIESRLEAIIEWCDYVISTYL